MSIFEPIMGGLKSDIFDRDQVQKPFHICRIQLQKNNSGVKKCLEIMSIKLIFFINHVFVGVFQYHPRAPKLEVAIGCQ